MTIRYTQEWKDNISKGRKNNIKNPYYKICKICEDMFRCSPSHNKSRKTCSIKCSNKLGTKVNTGRTRFKVGERPWNKDKKGEYHIWENKTHPMLGKTGAKRSLETRKKQRISAINYIKETRGNISPNIGKNEKQILDEIAKKIGYKIIRQYYIDGYFIDGYCKERNIVFEVDEKPKIKEKDIIRENHIKRELNCTFVRIPTYK